MLHCLYAAFRFVQEQLAPMLIANGFFRFNLKRQATHDHPEQNNASKIRLKWFWNKEKLNEIENHYKAQMSTSNP